VTSNSVVSLSMLRLRKRLIGAFKASQYLTRKSLSRFMTSTVFRCHLWDCCSRRDRALLECVDWGRGLAVSSCCIYSRHPRCLVKHAWNCRVHDHCSVTCWELASLVQRFGAALVSRTCRSSRVKTIRNGQNLTRRPSCNKWFKKTR